MEKKLKLDLKTKKRIYLQGNNGETDMENRLWTWREGRRGWVV